MSRSLCPTCCATGTSPCRQSRGWRPQGRSRSSTPTSVATWWRRATLPIAALRVTVTCISVRAISDENNNDAKENMCNDSDDDNDSSSDDKYGSSNNNHTCMARSTTSSTKIRASSRPYPDRLPRPRTLGLSRSAASAPVTVI